MVHVWIDSTKLIAPLTCAQSAGFFPAWQPPTYSFSIWRPPYFKAAHNLSSGNPVSDKSKTRRLVHNDTTLTSEETLIERLEASFLTWKMAYPLTSSFSTFVEKFMWVRLDIVPLLDFAVNALKWKTYSIVSSKGDQSKNLRVNATTEQLSTFLAKTTLRKVDLAQRRQSWKHTIQQRKT